MRNTAAEQHFSYSTSFELHPTNEVYRPQRTLSKPHTKGPQSAIVTGPAGQEIWTDKYGRVKVQFGWDRYGKNDENSSCWIRVSYPWAGKGFGGIQIPRIGQEVLVDFKNGDPDLPIIVGRTYNQTPCLRGDYRAQRRKAGFTATPSAAAQPMLTPCVLRIKLAEKKSGCMPRKINALK